MGVMKISSTNIRYSKQIMRKAFPESGTNGALFIHMSNMPWSNLIEDAVVLDTMYFDSHSGDKFCANMVYRWMNTNGVVTTLGENALAISLRTRFISKWSHLWDAYVAKYQLDRDWFTHEEYTEDDDITYGKKRESTTTHDTTDTEHFSSTNSSTDTRTDNLTETRNDTRTDNLTHTENSLHSVFGFNTTSQTGVPADSSTLSASDTGTQGNAGTTTNTGTEQNVGSSTTTDSRTFEKGGTVSDEEEYSGTDAHDKTGERDSYGLRAHSMQELLAAEKTLWMWDYFEDVFNDIDSMLCLKIYEPAIIRKEYELV